MHATSHPGATASPVTVRERIVWIDAARALAVLGVVLFHTGMLHFQPRLADAAPGPGSAWRHVDSLLGTFRMPMLLMLSGMLAAGKIRRGLGHGKALESAVANYYLYVVWLVVYFLLIHDPAFPLRVWSPANLVKQLVLPYTTLWFIQCLAVGVLLLAALRSVRPAYVLGGLLGVHLVGEGVLPDLMHPEVPMPLRTLPYYLYLALGAYFAPAVRRMAGSARATAVAGLGFAGSYAAAHLLDGQVRILYAVAHLGACLCAAILLMGLTRLACHWGGFARPASAIGRRTLSIYVMHLPMVAALGLLPAGYYEAVRGALASTPALAVAYPLCLVALMAGACLLLETGLRRAGGTFLFEMPEVLRRGVRRPEPGPVPEGSRSATRRGGGYSPRHAR